MIIEFSAPVTVWVSQRLELSKEEIRDNFFPEDNLDDISEDQICEAIRDYYYNDADADVADKYAWQHDWSDACIPDNWDMCDIKIISDN